MPTLTLIPEHKELLERHPEFTRKWVDGLRSGKYEQHKESMCDENNPQSACCLHVMEMECNGSRWEDGIDKLFPGALSNFVVLEGYIYPGRITSNSCKDLIPLPPLCV